MKNKMVTIWKHRLTLGLCAICLLVFSGCEGLGFLASPGAFEKKKEPVYNLQANQERKILVWVECPKSLTTKQLVQEKLTDGIILYMVQKMKISPENILQKPAATNNLLTVDPVGEARRLGAGYLLLVQVDQFDVTSLQVRNLYSGDLVARSILVDTETGLVAWPSRQPEGKMIHTGLEMEEGRDEVQGKIISGMVHCILRYLYPCEKVQFKHSTERISTQEIFELEND